MNKKEIKQKVVELLNAGRPKSEVFKTLSGGAVKDHQLAMLIASHPDDYRYEQNDRKVNGLITIMFVQALIAGLIGVGIGMKIGPVASWGFAALCASIPLLFAYGFYKNHVVAYNIYILLTIVQVPKMFTGITQTPAISTIGIAMGLAILWYVWHVRSLLFPDFAFISPKKIKGQYVFSD